MRDNEASALSLTHRQYDALMHLVDRLSAARDAVANRLAAARTDDLPPVHPNTPIRRRVTWFLQTHGHVHAASFAATESAVLPEKPSELPAARSKIFPRNLTARAAYRIAGNPESTRLESGVSNCFPGLEFDHRNLDRRFLPGVVVEYVVTSGPARVNAQGGQFVQLDFRDSGLLPSALASADEVAALQEDGATRWFDGLAPRAWPGA